ncbi:hypothetical protein [Anaplasma capra]|uniref:hypothetical protein n=1 Tax=Anaplasma capra TaxID=1562740 RepID=UPI0021D61538|nr:hypothetical protein [Anaplasma capra]MCU7611610.1 hypothetical protein [Anaplasma capra]MCU7612242.1 hypothetical protein [Anaplasma capra]
MECFSVELVSPDRRLDFTGVRSLCARTATGALVVMAHHERTVMDLLPGKITLRDATSVLGVVMVSNAIMSIRDNVCTITADVLLLPGDCDKEKLKDISDAMSKSVGSGGLFDELARADLEFIDEVMKE